MGKFVDLTGQRFGRLVVKERAKNDKTHHTRWVCVCDCGNYVTVSQANLSSGNTQSCGCFRKENSQRNGSKSNLHHGQHGTRIYRIWANMLSRCRNPKVRSYKDYGDRGIKVCDEWLIFAGTSRMNVAGEPLLASTRLAKNEDESIRFCHLHGGL